MVRSCIYTFTFKDIITFYPVKAIGSDYLPFYIYSFFLFSRRIIPPYLEIINGTIMFPPDLGTLVPPGTTPVPAREDVIISSVVPPERYTCIVVIYVI